MCDRKKVRLLIKEAGDADLDSSCILSSVYLRLERERHQRFDYDFMISRQIY